MYWRHLQIRLKIKNGGDAALVTITLSLLLFSDSALRPLFMVWYQKLLEFF